MARTIENTPLAQNPAPTAQQVFDAVVTHARTMSGRCTKNANEPGCLYRGPNETACFVGALLTDDEAEGLDALSEATVRDLARQDRLPVRLLPHLELLTALQEVHDFDKPEIWMSELCRIGTRRGFNVELAA